MTIINRKKERTRAPKEDQQTTEKKNIPDDLYLAFRGVLCACVCVCVWFFFFFSIDHLLLIFIAVSGKLLNE